MAQQRSESAPKPFGAVAGSPAPMVARPPGHERWEPDRYTGVLDCTLEVLTPLHIGSGSYRLVDGLVVKEAARLDDEPIVPGSSLKGAFRAAAEAISASCEATTRRQACPRPPSEFCVCCRIFGGLGYLGRVRFTDARAPAGTTFSRHEVPRLWQPRVGLDGPKFYRHGQPARGQEPWEVIQPGTRLDFSLHVTSLTDAELALVLTAMGAIGDLTPKLGGGKPRGLGSVRVTVERARFRAPSQAARTYAARERVMDGDQLRRVLGAANHLIDAKALNQLRSLWTYPGAAPAPAGLY